MKLGTCLALTGDKHVLSALQRQCGQRQLAASGGTGVTPVAIGVFFPSQDGIRCGGQRALLPRLRALCI